MIKSEKQQQTGNNKNPCASFLKVGPNPALFVNSTVLAVRACTLSFLTLHQHSINKWFCDTSKSNTLWLLGLPSLFLVSSNGSYQSILTWSQKSPGVGHIFPDMFLCHWSCPVLQAKLRTETPFLPCGQIGQATHWSPLALPVTETCPALSLEPPTKFENVVLLATGEGNFSVCFLLQDPLWRNWVEAQTLEWIDTFPAADFSSGYSTHKS